MHCERATVGVNDGDMGAFLKALDELDGALDVTENMIREMKDRCAAIRVAHAEGRPLKEIVPREGTPLLVQLLTNTTNLLHAYGNRVRRTEARALHDEGMTMDEIARLFGVTRQRVSALLRSKSAPDET